jgi:opacity protein-like surface antigen
MKSIFFIILSMLIFSSGLFAQDTTIIPLQKGRLALQFLVNYDFTLRPFQGGTISAKYHLGDNTAIRFGIGLFGSLGLKSNLNSIDTTKAQNININLAAQLIEYLETVDDISLYAGAGPYYTRYFYKSVVSQMRSSEWSLGVSGVLGVEWFFKSNMSLSAEYGMLIYYDKYYYHSTYSADNENSSSLGITSDNQFKFGLSIYL